MVDVDGDRLPDAVGRAVPGAHAVVADLSAVGECDRVIAEARERWGRKSTCWSTVPAILHRVDLSDLDEATFERILNTDLDGVLALPAESSPRWSSEAGGGS